MEPMPLSLYKAIVEDFKKHSGYSRVCEVALRKKYKDVPPSTIGSIISLLIQRSMKQNYRKSTTHSAKYLDVFNEQVKSNSRDAILKASEQQGINPALFARLVLQRSGNNPAKVKTYMKDTTNIEEKDLAYQIYLAILNDNQYGHYADVIKQSIGLEYELRLQRELTLLDISFSDENALRSRGYDKTPDFKLDVPIAVDGFIINWVESKALFGDEENHSGYLKEQLTCYYNRFGPGLVIYWFGYLETLDKTPEVNNMFILRTHFPAKESITHFKLD